MKYIIFIFATLFTLASCQKEKVDPLHEITVDSVFVNQIYVANNSIIRDVNYDDIVISFKFSETVDTLLFNSEKISITGGSEPSFTYRFDKKSQSLTVIPDAFAAPFTLYRLLFDQGSNLGGFIYENYTFTFRTRLDTTPKFPEIPDDSLLTLVQKKTFGYFWDHAHPISGLARERYGSGETVTSGGSGFGLMAVIVGIERGFVTREEGFERLNKIVNFLIRPRDRQISWGFSPLAQRHNRQGDSL